MADENTRNRILMTAGPMFARMGYQATTVRDICDQAGVNLASVNYYFGDKLQLYIEVVRMARAAQESQFPSLSPASNGDAETRLRRFVRLLLNRLAIGGPTTWQVQLLVREFVNPGEACREIVEAYFRPYFETLLKIIDELAGRPFPNDKRLKIGFSIIGQCLHYRIAQPIIGMFVERTTFEGFFDMESLVDHIASFSLGGIRHQSALSQSRDSSFSPTS